MEFLNSTISINPQISPAVPFFTWKSRKNPSKLTIPNSTKRPLQSSPPYLFRSIPLRKFQISAHFGRPSNRQNYLRKKLTQKQQQQQQVSQNLVNEFDIYHANFDSSGETSENFEKKSGQYNESEFDNSSEDSKNLERSSPDDSVRRTETELRKNKIGESIMWNKLESWVEQYRKDSEFWGIGTGPIFTIFQNAEGKVERVVVNEDEIMRRSQVDLGLDNEIEDLAEVNSKISVAKDLAREMENGGNVILKNSSVAKVLLAGEESRLTEAIRGVMLKPGSFSRMSRIGVLAFCGLSVVWAIRRLFTVGNDRKDLTRLEKEMLRRKMKARKEEEKMVKGSVEVMQDPVEPKSMFFGRPQLDKEELVNSIIKAKGSRSLVDCTGFQNKEFKDKIEEIRAMARHARETEGRDSLTQNCDEEDYQGSNKFSSHSPSPENDSLKRKEVYNRDSDNTRESTPSTDPKEDIGQAANEASDGKCKTQFHDIPNGHEILISEVSNKKPVSESSDLNEANLYSNGQGWQSGKYENSSRKKLRIIKSAEEAREYLSRRHHIVEVNQKRDVEDDEHTDVAIPIPSANVASGNMYQSSHLSGIDDFPSPAEDYSTGSEKAKGNLDSLNDLKKSRTSSGHEVGVSNKDAGISGCDIPRIKESDIRTGQNSNSKNDISSFLGDVRDFRSYEVDDGGSLQPEEVPNPLKNHRSEDTENNEALIGLEEPATVTAKEDKDSTAELAPLRNNGNWIEKNFHEFEPIIKKIGVGFRDGYLLAREKASQELDSKSDFSQIKYDGAESELEWMKDERLREIVFKVRDNELSGKDPFHLMDEEDKCTFFSGLEKKVEQENEKLLKLHEYFHSNIENLDYGADGISLYDPPEKIIPRWKVPPAEKNPEFLNSFVEQRKELVAESLKNSFLSKKTANEAYHISEKHSSHENSTVAADVSYPRTELQKDSLASSKTIIEGSDGSVRAGKRSGKEYWQHTKKWSQGFLESYNAERDPEVKAIMRDIGKDLDRWITEKEIQEAADLMDKIPEKGQKFIKQKLDKVKREMELFGPQAVVSKYREYAEVKEEDYLWWLDLPFVLCIELYTIENGEQRVGFYSLEMSADLELDPKQYHVIAFEDAGDCKNLCYIIQAKMEVLGNGNAFVVARPPKDAFREAKANGSSVTVIRKGQLQLNVDQSLEEVEESVIEIGSKIYHDKITKERSVDINALMKGVFGISKPAKRKRSKRKSKGASNHETTA